MISFFKKYKTHNCIQKLKLHDINDAFQNYRVMYEITHDSDRLDTLNVDMMDALQRAVKEWIANVPPFIFSGPYLETLIVGVSIPFLHSILESLNTFYF